MQLSRALPPLRWLHALVVLTVLCAVRLHAQVLPPIYRPLPTEEQQRLKNLSRSLHDSAGARTRAADSLGQVRSQVPSVSSLVLDFERRAAEMKAAAEVHRRDAAARGDSSNRIAIRSDSLSVQLGRWKARRDSLMAAPLTPPPGDSTPVNPSEMDRDRARVRDSTYRALMLTALSDTITTVQVTKDSLRGVAASVRDEGVGLARDAVRDESEARRIADDADRLAKSGNETIVNGAFSNAITYERSMSDRYRRMSDSLGKLVDGRQSLADRRWFPIRSIDDAKLYYGARGGRLGYLRGATATYNNSRGASANIDLFEYYIDYGRLSWTMVWNARQPSSDSSAARSALDRFLLGGGDVALAFMTPFAFIRGDGWSLALSGDVRGAMSVSSMGPFPLGDTGLIFYGGGTHRLLGEVTFAARVGMIRHDSDIIGKITGTGTVVGYGQLTAGWELHNLLKVVVSTTTGPTVVQRSLAYTIQFKI